MKKQILISLLCILSILCVLQVATAEIQSLPPQKQGECFEITQTCDNCTYITLEYVTYPTPNSTKAYINTNMTQVGHGYNYTFCETDLTGQYIISTCGDMNGINTCPNYDFDVTSGGYSDQGSEFKIFIWIIFIVAVLGLFATLFLTIFKLATATETIYGVLITWAFLILLIVSNYLGNTFLQYDYISRLTAQFLQVCIWTNGVLPVLSLIIAIFVRSTKKKGVLSPQEISGWN